MAELNPEQNPLPWIQVGLSRIDLVRFINCPLYRSCLNWAASEKWEGWICTSCEVWSSEAAKEEAK